MRTRALLLTAGLVLALNLSQLHANWGRSGAYQTVYVGDAVATSYLLPASYVVPTTYVSRSYVATSALVPTSYVYRPTSYVLSPTVSYVPTAYVATTWRAPLRRTTYIDYTPLPTSYVVPTSYTVARSYTVPTAYYVPTSYSVASDAVLADCCDTGVTVAPSAPVATQSMGVTAQSPVYPSSPAPAVPPPSRPSGGAITSQPRNGGSGTATGLEEPPLNPGEPAAPTPAPDKPEASAPGTVSPPSSPARDTFENLDPQGGRRDAMRPAVTTFAPRADLLPPGTLRVEVVSGVDGKPVNGARVVFADARGRFPDRVATSNSQGLLTVNLPDGDWSVQIADDDPKKNLTFDSVTSSGGKFTDPTGRAILSLRLSR